VAGQPSRLPKWITRRCANGRLRRRGEHSTLPVPPAERPRRRRERGGFDAAKVLPETPLPLHRADTRRGCQVTRRGRLWPPPGPARVLLASRHPTALSFAAQRLGGGAYAGCAVRDRPRAISMATSWRPHLVLADVEFLDDGFLAAIRAPANDSPSV